jgi:hypothetical protein
MLTLRSSYLVLVLALTGCAGPRFQAPTVPDSVIKRVETRELPPNPATEPIPENIPRGDWVTTIAKGECLDTDGTPELGATNPCPAKSGIVISEERAYRSALFRIRYVEIRKTFDADRMVWSAHRELYEERLKLAGQAIEDLQPSWFDRNKLPLGVVGGVVLGIATSVAILSVTDRQ